jgi:uncharacterized protein YkwD
MQQRNRIMRMSMGFMALALIFAGVPASAGPVPADLRAAEASIRDRTNALRAKRRLPPLAREERLERAAREFAAFMARREEFGHEADGRTPTERARAAGYRDCMVSENIGYQMRTTPIGPAELAERLMSGWIASAGHRRNLLDEEAQEIGVAVAHSEETSRYYAVQLFGRPESSRVSFEVRNESARPVRYRVGEKDFVLEGRRRQRHQVCVDNRLVIEALGGERAFRPHTGDAYTITPRGSLEAPAPE